MENLQQAAEVGKAVEPFVTSLDCQSALKRPPLGALNSARFSNDDSFYWTPSGTAADGGPDGESTQDGQGTLSLYAQRWSRRRKLGIDRETVSRHVRLDEQSAASCELNGGGVSKPANAPISGPGSTETKAANQKPSAASKRRKAAQAST